VRFRLDSVKALITRRTMCDTRWSKPVVLYVCYRSHFCISSWNC